MREVAIGHKLALGGAESMEPARWSDLRSWLRLVEEANQVKHIDALVDPDEELAAITFLAGRMPTAPALLFNNLVGNRSDARVL